MVRLKTIAFQKLLDGACSYTFRVLRQAVLFGAIAHSGFGFFFYLMRLTGKAGSENHGVVLVQVVKVVEVVN